MPTNNKQNAFIGKKIKSVPKKQQEIGIDVDDTLLLNMINGVDEDVDTNVLQSFTNSAQTREDLYNLIDTMAQDDTISAVLETYAEDTVETNDAGQVIWVESQDENVSKYCNFLIKSLNIDKNIYSWAYSLYKYGDVYIKLFRESEYGDDILFNSSNTLNEDINISLNKPNDHYANYVEMVANPGEMFELTRFGKTMGYIKAPVSIQHTTDTSSLINNYMTYKMNKNDVTVYGATDFVHASLRDGADRAPEEVRIFVNKEDEDAETGKYSTYKVKHGQSLLYNSFKIWRELTLLENSILLNRLTRSSIVRLLNVDVGDMPKDQIQNYMSRLKSMIAQKSALNIGQSMSEYTNPSSIDSIVYIPTHGTQGNVSAQSIGGDVDPKQLTDLEYFRDKLFANLRTPKQFFGFTSDSTGFNGGTSLSIISSRYGKSIKRTQHALSQLVEDILNLFIIDRGLTSYINKFTVRMQEPVTQESIDRREALRNRMGTINDILSQVQTVVTDETLKAKITKIMLSDAINNADITNLMQEQIDILEKAKEESNNNQADFNREPADENEGEFDNTFGPSGDHLPSLRQLDNDEEETPIENEFESQQEPTEIPVEEPEEIDLPSGDDLGIDFTSDNY